MRIYKFFMLLPLAAVALTACGGGSDPAAPAVVANPVANPVVVAVPPPAIDPIVVTVPPVTQTPTVVDVPVVVVPPVDVAPITVVPTPTYVANSEEFAAFSLLNKERNRCGFGLLAQSVQLDTAAKAHSDYQIINSLATHFEDKAMFPTGFTGVFPADRVLLQGYTGAGDVADEFSIFNTTDPLQIKTGFGEMGIRSLLNAPYHMGGLVAGYRDVGVAVRSNADAGGTVRGIFVHVNAAYKTADGKQMLAAEDVKTYPCDGALGVNRKLTGESPNPVPGRVLSTSPLGSSVYVALREGKTLTIASASMVKVFDGAAVTLRAPITASNDPYAPCASGCFKSHEGYVAADAPLEANTNYRVVIAGTNDGVAFTRNFIFTTAK